MAAVAPAVSHFKLQPKLNPSSAVPVNPLLYLAPPPAQFPLHARLVRSDPSSSSSPSSTSSALPPRVLVVGDIHGCLDELRALVALAGLDAGRGDTLVAVGDLVAKGPKSAEVLRWIREQGHFAVLGNHEQFLLKNALLAGRLAGLAPQTSNDDLRQWTAEQVALADPASEQYAATYYARMNGYHSVANDKCQHYRIAAELTDEELQWMATLPLTIDLSDAFSNAATPAAAAAAVSSSAAPSSSPSAASSSWIVVHAGLLPGLPLHSQHPFHMTNMRNWDAASGLPSEQTSVGSAWSIGQAALPADSSSASSSSSQQQPPQPPPAVIFGHDAVRGFQHPTPNRVGLDTGCCFGKQPSGLLLPEDAVFSVTSGAVYSKPSGVMDVAHKPPQPTGVKLHDLQCVKPAKAHAATSARPSRDSCRDNRNEEASHMRPHEHGSALGHSTFFVDSSSPLVSLSSKLQEAA